jgi:hypothetical protein
MLAKSPLLKDGEAHTLQILALLEKVNPEESTCMFPHQIPFLLLNFEVAQNY